ncbi:MAG: excinuclease ABC subunit UvrA [Planctomycetia bacterium]
MPARPAIHVRGARQHNLKGVDVEIPLGALTVITGVSGSGKSSLALDTLYAEGQRRYVESFSAYARQFLERLERPEVDAVDGLLPAVAIERAGVLRGSRSTVGTMTELLDHLKLLWAKVGELHCPGCGRTVERESPERVARRLLARPGTRRAVLCFERPHPGEAGRADLVQDLAAAGFPRVLHGDEAVTLSPDGSNLPPGDVVRVVVDRLVLGSASRTRLVDSLELAFRAGGGRALLRLLPQEGAPAEDLAFSSALGCAACRRTFRAPTPSLFSFNSPLGACATCHGFGRTTGVDWDLVVPDPALSLEDGAVKPFEMPSTQGWKDRLLAWAQAERIPTHRPWSALGAAQRKRVLEGDGRWKGVAGFFAALEEKTYKVHVRVLIARYRGYPTCPDCGGARLAEEGRAWTVGGLTLPQALALDVTRARAFFDALQAPAGAEEVVDLLLGEVRSRLACLEDVGLGYLALDRQARTLSGGEIQRVNLTAALGSHLVNTLFVLDEPSIGLHPRDNERLVRLLRRLCEQGNTVVVVEHDPAILAAADHLVDLGPGAGADGGRVVASGTPAQVQRVEASLTGQWLAGRRSLAALAPAEPAAAGRAAARAAAPVVGVRGARAHNLQGVDLLVRLGELTVLSGVSGSGKSSLAHDVFTLALARAKGAPLGTPGAHDAVVGAQHVDEVVLVDQVPLAGSSRANPATFVGAWDGVRALYARLPAARERGFTASTFSFNVDGGRCARCAGEGRERVEMQFLSDVEVPCEDCGGRRFRPEVLAVQADGLSVADVLDLTAAEALQRFAGQSRITGPLQPLVEVGLGYLRLGQPLSTLSAGESQRLRLAEALAEPRGGRRRMYVFDEPTTGLHLEDVAVLVRALRRLCERGHGVLVVEHHLDVLWAADRVLDLGPGGGPDGGRIVADGTPAHVAAGGGETARFMRQHRDAPAAPALPPGKRVARDDGAIHVRGAREHNLRGLDVDLPRDAFVVVSGPSGSGKSTLAFDIVFAEGQRRYIETLSAYARQFVGQLARPDVDHVAGIPPTVAIEQRRTRGGRRSTVATVTEVAHYLRLLFARCGVPHCPACGREMRALTPAVLVQRLQEEHAREDLRLFAPVVLGRKGHHREVLEDMASRGVTHARVDGRVVSLSPLPVLDRYKEHDLDELVARVVPGRTPLRELARAVDAALLRGKGLLHAVRPDGSVRALSVTRTCPADGQTVPEPDPRLFSHNSRRGWCPDCQGLGTQPRVDPARMPIEPGRTLRQGPITPLNVDAALARTFVREATAYLGITPSTRWQSLDAVARRRLLKGADTPRGRFVGAAERLERFLAECPDVAIDWFGAYATRQPCSGCGGERLRPEARAVRVGGRTLPSLLAEPAAGLVAALAGLRLTGRDAAVAVPILREVEERVGFLGRVGLDYLTLDRDATTLSGGESQRIRLAASLGSHLRGVCYVLDEPTIGLHPRDNGRLLEALAELRWRGNSLLVVEHDVETIRRADHVIDLGPGGGREGGRVVATGSPAALARDPQSPTGRVLARGAPPPPPEPGAPAGWLELQGARLHNLRGVDVRVPLGRLVAVTGVSGSGKSTLVREVLLEGVQARLAGRDPVACQGLRGVEALARVLEVDATPVGKTPRSVPATYLGIWDLVREALARTLEARQRGYGPGRFSFNVPAARGGGRCEACEGRGHITVEMSFLPDVETPCEACRGARFTEETNEVRWHGLSAAQLLALTFAEAATVFRDVPRIAPLVQMMVDVGLGYLALGQGSTTLSGGESQRMKLVTELGRPQAEGHTLYVLDEPTTGLHGEDVDRLLALFRRLVERGDTVLVIEHHLELVARADHVIDLGPEGGAGGGRVVAAGTVRQVAEAKGSHTGAALRDLWGGRVPPAPGGSPPAPAAAAARARGATPSRASTAGRKQRPGPRLG